MPSELDHVAEHQELGLNLANTTGRCLKFRNPFRQGREYCSRTIIGFAPRWKYSLVTETVFRASEWDFSQTEYGHGSIFPCGGKPAVPKRFRPTSSNRVSDQLQVELIISISINTVGKEI